MKTFEGLEEVGNILSNIYTSLKSKQKITKCFDYYSLEYFSCAIFNALFDYNLVNLNEQNENSSFIDLIDENEHVGVQVTAENPNSVKLEKSIKAFKGYKIDRLIVFFFSESKATRIKSLNNEEIWTLKKIYEYVQTYPLVGKKILKELKIWNDFTDIFPSDIKTAVAHNTNEIINQMGRLKKYDHSLFLPDYNDEKCALMFAGKTYSNFVFKAYSNLFFESQLGNFLCSHDKSGFFKSMKSEDAILDLTNNEIDEHKNEIFKNYYDSAENKNNKDYYQISNRSTYSVFNQILLSNHASNCSLMSVVRPAGQGKTVFCCNLTLNLLANGITCFFITPVLSTSSPYEEFKKQVERIGLKGNYLSNLEVLIKCLKYFNEPLLIVIDALNEYPNSNLAINSIGDIIKDIKSFDFMPKILISSRNKIYNDFEPNLKGLFGSIFCLNPIFIDNSKVKDLFFEKYNVHIKRNYVLDNLFKQSRLFIKIFCETYKNKEFSFNKYNFLDLFNDYFSERSEMDYRDRLFDDKEAFFETINAVSKEMINENKFDSVQMSKFQKETRSNIRKLSDGDIFTIVKEDNCDVVRFVFDEYRDYFLLDLFKNKTAKEVSEFFKLSSITLDGLCRNIILYRRNGDFDKKEDLKHSWYYFGTIDALINNLPIDEIDELDQKVMLSALNNINIKDSNNPNSSALLDKLVHKFLSIPNYNVLLSPNQLLLLDDNGKENVKLVINKEYYIESLLGEFNSFHFEAGYINELIKLLVFLKVKLSTSHLRMFKKAILVNFKKDSICDCLSVGINEEVINFLEV